MSEKPVVNPRKRGLKISTLGAKVSKAFYDEVNQTALTQGIRVSRLIRTALVRYMLVWKRKRRQAL